MHWRPAVENHPQNWHHGDVKDLLTSTIRDTLERYMEHVKGAGTSSVRAELDELLKSNPEYSIFKRLRLHIYRQHPGSFAAEIEKTIIYDFDDWQVWHEYALLLAQEFPSLSERTRRGYLQAVDGGPAGEKDEQYIRNWRTRRIALVRDHLLPAELERYADVVSDTERITHPDFLATHGSWAGPTSPISEDELRAMPLDTLIEHLAVWEPSGKWYSPSREGLGVTLSGVVAKDAERFSKEALRFF